MINVSTDLGHIYSIDQELPLSANAIAVPNTKYVSDGDHVLSLPSIHTTPIGSAVVLYQAAGNGIIRDAVSEYGLDDEEGDTTIDQPVPEDVTIGVILNHVFGKRQWQRLPDFLFGGAVQQPAIPIPQVPAQTIREIYVAAPTAVADILEADRDMGKLHHLGEPCRLISINAKWKVPPSSPVVLTVTNSGDDIFTDDLPTGTVADTFGAPQSTLIDEDSNLFVGGDEVRVSHVSGPMDGIGLTLAMVFEQVI